MCRGINNWRDIYPREAARTKDVSQTEMWLGVNGANQSRCGALWVSGLIIKQETASRSPDKRSRIRRRCTFLSRCYSARRVISLITAHSLPLLSHTLDRRRIYRMARVINDKNALTA